MDIKAFRGLSGTYNVRANERERAAPRDIECIVHFLDNTQNKFTVDRRSKGQALLDCVFKHLNLVETDYFGLKYLTRESITSSTTALSNITPFTTLGNSNIGRNCSSTDHSNEISVEVANDNGEQQKHKQHKHRQTQLLNNNSSIIKNGIDKINIKSNNQHKSKSLSHDNNSTNDSLAHLNNTSQHSPSSDVSLSSSPINLNIATTSTSASTTTTPSITHSIETVADRLVNSNINPELTGLTTTDTTGVNNCLTRYRLESDVKSSTTKPPCQHKSSNDSARTDESSNQSELAHKVREERWLDPSKSIRKQYKGDAPFEFYFRVRFYVSDPSKLAYDTTRSHLYMQLRQDFLNRRLIVPPCSAILLASYTLQSEVGDYKRDLGESYASRFRLLPDENDDLRRKVIELHKQHKSLSSADAEYQFLEHAAKELDCYGVEFYEAKDQYKTNVLIGVSSNGIVVFKDSKRMNQFSWAKIIKIMFKKKIFSIQLRRLEGENKNCDTNNNSNNFIEYNILSNQACKSFWEECVAQHSFFRLHQPKSPPKKFFSFLNFGSKFQYNGKTEYQTMEESRKRTFSNFSRSLSKRYARRTLPIGRPSWGESTSRQTQTRDINSDAQSHLSSTSSSSNSRSIINQTATLAASIKYIKKGLESGDLINQFEGLSRRKEDESHEESRLMENIDKNRYQDILPYDSTRVPLIDSMTGDYINASFVDMPVPSGVVNSYIATQGPLSSTCDDFWQMVWEQNSSLIIMVTPLVEAGRVKCHKYWPDEREEQRYGQLMIKNLSEKSKTATINREIQIMDVKTGEKRTTTQIQYKAWPDHEVPEDCSHFLKLVGRVKKHRLLKPKDPIVVHCSAGIGRTGVLILMETAICFMEAGEPIYPIKILENMRKQRAMLIQTSSQFRFVAEAICKVYDQKMYKKTKKHRKK